MESDRPAPKALYYGVVCDECFALGNFAETTIPRSALWRPCIVCEGKPGHQVDAATIAKIFAIRGERATEPA